MWSWPSALSCYAQSLSSVTPKTIENNRIIHTRKSEAEVTNNKKTALEVFYYWSNEANYWQIRSIARLLYESRATFSDWKRRWKKWVIEIVSGSVVEQTDLVIRTAVLPVAARNASTDAPTRRHSPTDRTEHQTREKIVAATTEMESLTDHRECSQMGWLK